MMNPILDYIVTNKFYFLLFLVTGIIFFFVFKGIEKVKKNGKFTIARVINYEPRRSGNALTIEFTFGGRNFVTTEDALCNCVGAYIFIKVLPAEPEKNVIVYEDKLVPQCILNRPVPDSGWNHIPDCH